MKGVSIFADKESQERERRLAVELADSYRSMQQIFAWRDLTELIDKIAADSNLEVDAAPIETLSVAMVARARGLREAVGMIRRHIAYKTSEGPK